MAKPIDSGAGGGKGGGGGGGGGSNGPAFAISGFADGTTATSWNSGFTLTGTIDGSINPERVVVVVNGIEYIAIIDGDTWSVVYDGPGLVDGTLGVEAYYVTLHPKNGREQKTSAEPLSVEITPGIEAPVIEEIAPSGDMLVISGRAEPGSRIEVTDGTTTLETYANPDGTWEVTGFTNGSATFTATATDAGGNSAGSDDMVFIGNPQSSWVELVAASDSGVSDSDGLTNVTQPMVRVYFGDAATVDRFRLVIDGLGEPIGYVLEPHEVTQGWAEVAVNAPLAEGPHSIKAEVVTASGTDFSSPLAIVIDTIPDPVQITEARDEGGVITGGISTDATPELRGTAAAHATVTLLSGTTVLATTQADAAGNWAVLLAAPLADGFYTFTAEVVPDAAGNVGRAFFSLEIDAVPDDAGPRPQDEPMYADGQMWHLAALGDIESVWADYSGRGVKVGIYDDGIEYAHHDLDDNYDPSLHIFHSGTELDPAPTTTTEGVHGTAVAGVIAAEANGEGTVGIAHDARLAGVNIFTGAAAVGQAGFTTAINEQDRFDVVNHSWGFTPYSAGHYTNDTDATLIAILSAFEDAVVNGRGGLGTNIVKSAGNDADTSQGSALNATRFTISVAAFDSDFDASFYTNRGANLLVSAPSSGYTADGDLRIATTDRLGGNGYAEEDWLTTANGFGGTSSAAPTVVGVIALMLEANPELGWRDVQNILAHSATHIGGTIGVKDVTEESVPVDSDDNGTYESLGLMPREYFMWNYNGASTHNGGGLHFSEDYGFGAVNVHDAVRMAEVWHLFGTPQTSVNEVTRSTGVVNAGISVSGEGSSASYQFTYSGDAMSLDYVDISISLTTRYVEEVMLELTSPGGTTMTLMAPITQDYTYPPTYFSFGIPGLITQGYQLQTFTWTFGATGFKGEDPAAFDGIWTVTLTELDADYDTATHGAEADGSTLNSIELDFYGSLASANDVYHYTDEVFAAIAGPSGQARMALSDGDGGQDWLNMAAMTHDLIVNLGAIDISGAKAGTAASATAGVFIGSGATAIEHVVGGDGDDTLIGSAGDNTLIGMRGDDVLTGGDGIDTFVFVAGFGSALITDFSGDIIDFSGVTEISSFDEFMAEGTTAVIGSDLVYDFGGDGADVLTLAGIGAGDLSETDFRFWGDTLLA